MNAKQRLFECALDQGWGSPAQQMAHDLGEAVNPDAEVNLEQLRLVEETIRRCICCVDRLPDKYYLFVMTIATYINSCK